jgi:hypothetical protein
MDSDIARKTIRAIRVVVEQTINGKLQEWTEYPKMEMERVMYIGSVKELLDLIKRLNPA